MNRLGFAVVVAITSTTVFACSSASTDPTANNGGADEIVAKVATCDDGALASDRLQAANGGPDAKSAVTCDAGYALCKIDPKGKDNDVCSDPSNCYACSKPAQATELRGACPIDTVSCPCAGGFECVGFGFGPRCGSPTAACRTPKPVNHAECPGFRCVCAGGSYCAEFSWNRICPADCQIE